MNGIGLRIDTRYFHMCIYRHALRMIGEPKFVNFGYDPETTRLIVIGTWVDDRKSVRVRYNKSGSFLVCSKPLIVGIQKVSGILTAPGSYMVEGEVLEAEKILVFRLENALESVNAKLE